MKVVHSTLKERNTPHQEDRGKNFYQPMGDLKYSPTLWGGGWGLAKWGI